MSATWSNVRPYAEPRVVRSTMKNVATEIKSIRVTFQLVIRFQCPILTEISSLIQSFF